MLAVCVCLRAYYLCVSFHPVFGEDSIFGVYFLAPFVLAIAVLLIEASILAGSPRMRRIGLSLPGAMFLLCVFDHRTDATYTSFSELFNRTLHVTPLYFVLLATLLFFG